MHANARVHAHPAGSRPSSQAGSHYQSSKRPRAEEPSAVTNDLQRRVAALEDALEREQADRQHDQAKMGFLQDKVAVSKGVSHPRCGSVFLRFYQAQ